MRIVNSPGQDYTPVKGTAGVAAQLPADKKHAPQPQADTLLPDQAEIKREELEQAIEKMEQTVSVFNKHFKFSIHEKTHRVMVQVIDSRTNEVVNEIPPRKILDMVAAFQDMVGIIIDKKA